MTWGKLKALVELYSIFDDNILYEGFCKTTDYLRLILQNLFGGDGHNQEWINKQFNDRLFKENIEQ